MLANTERDDQKETARIKHDLIIFTDPRKGIEKVQKTKSIKWDPRHMLAKFQMTARIMDCIKWIQSTQPRLRALQDSLLKADIWTEYSRLEQWLCWKVSG